MDEDLTPEELEQLRRRHLIRAAVVIAVVVAMVATLLFPVLIRIVHTPTEPDTVIALRVGVTWRTMES